MGALSGVGAGAYGVVRGVRDATADQQEEEAFGTDQAIRNERLNQEKALGPKRQRALDVELSDAEETLRQRKEAGAENTEMIKDRDEARAKKKVFDQGIGQFHATGDPQYVAEAISNMYPDKAKGLSARRTPEGAIQLLDPDGKVLHDLKGQKWEDGTAMTPDDQFSMMALDRFDPMKQFETRWKHKMDMEKAGETSRRAIEVAKIRQTGVNARATDKADREKSRRVSAELRTVSSEVERSLKTTSIPGHFTSSYSNDDDAHLLPKIKEKAADIYKGAVDDEDDTMTPQKASRAAIEETRTAYVSAKRDVLGAAEKLRAKKLDPRDNAAIAAAAQKGDVEAKAYASALARVARIFGEDTVQYLMKQLPSGKK
jgi:hypothetical protein